MIDWYRKTEFSNGTPLSDPRPCHSVRPWDPAVFAAVVLALATAGTLASFIPARRATRVEPVDALRFD
jgi:hypothetical protein